MPRYTFTIHSRPWWSVYSYRYTVTAVAGTGRCPSCQRNDIGSAGKLSDMIGHDV